MIRPRKQPDICQGTCSLTFRQYSTEDTDFSSVISIHAPAEGATKRGFAEWQNNVYFNPRSRGGSDAITYKEIREAIIFQSTLPRRERLHCALHCLRSTKNFEAAVVKAANLGGDADTIAAITGGLAGALYGYEKIPLRWRMVLDSGTKSTLISLTGDAAKNHMEA